MSCADGEEPRREALAKSVEEKIDAMRAGFGEIGEQRIVVMAAIAIADEAADARDRVASLESEAEKLRQELDAARAAADALMARATTELEAATRRLEQVSADLQKPATPRLEFP
jgi:cell division protein ZapA